LRFSAFLKISARTGDWWGGILGSSFFAFPYFLLKYPKTEAFAPGKNKKINRPGRAKRALQRLRVRRKPKKR